ncbi:hypothetical protein AVEN_185334-1 [Araneus ventricosus]|uniref:Uncharacterized protein n=1 Tax=Araneus ventricosus TaxID=182803 RepID=A0A4Y2URJ1_ARAVE|nr:hypothetical protein AVEN_185334-1 [Araneus ventricosus]
MYCLSIHSTAILMPYIGTLRPIFRDKCESSSIQPHNPIQWNLRHILRDKSVYHPCIQSANLNGYMWNSPSHIRDKCVYHPTIQPAILLLHSRESRDYIQRNVLSSIINLQS